MSITDELREWLDTGKVHWFGRRPEIEPMLDRIDAEHESKVSYWQDASYKDGYDEGLAFCDRLREAAESREDVTLWGVDYVALPLDADGVPIRVGDVMDSKVDYLFDGKPFTVRALVLCEDGWEVADGRFGNRYEPDSLHHHPSLTVEDVLEEFVARWMDMHHDDLPALKAEYAAKLRLRGDDE